MNFGSQLYYSYSEDRDSGDVDDEEPGLDSSDDEEETEASGIDITNAYHCQIKNTRIWYMGLTHVSNHTRIHTWDRFIVNAV